MLLIFSLAACITEDNFADQLWAISCQRAEECDKGTFQQFYDDQAECVDESQEDIEDFEDFVEDCEFDAEEAADCLNAWRTSDCEDVVDGTATKACDEVYDCG